MSQQAYPYPVFQPAMRIISSITNAYPAVVTTTFNHQYITGTIIRLDIPLLFGMQQANQQYAPINVLSDTTFSIAIDTTTYDAFVPSTQYPFSQQYAQTVPIAEINSILTAAVQNVLPYKAT